MRYWQSILDVHPELTLAALGENRVRIEAPAVAPAEFDIVYLGTLSEPLACEILAALGAQSSLVVYERASRKARQKLREAGVSYAGRDGSVYLRAPGLYVDRETRASAVTGPGWGAREVDTSTTRNPYTARGSRVPRWLLLHHRQSFSVSDIAQAVAVSPPAVSRIVRALEDQALVQDEALRQGDARRRHIKLARPRGVLDEWALRWERRRIARRWWDIGARDADEAIAAISDLDDRDQPPRWVVGGLAGAVSFRRTVEPTDVLVWVHGDELGALMSRLDPERGRAGERGMLQVAVMPDPWVLSLAQPGEPPIADPVQLWLDCATAGERALVAAEAVAEAMGW